MGHHRIRNLALLTAALAGGTAIAGVRAIRKNQAGNAEDTANVADDLRPWLGAIPPRLLSGTLPAPPNRDSVGNDIVAAVVSPGIGQEVLIPGAAGEPLVPGFLYDTGGRADPSGAVVWFHGGGMIVGAPWMDHALCNRIAEELGVLVLSVDYRLAPEHPFPAGPDDCFTALAWLHENADALGVDPQRIAVGGESAGGGLAAAVAQMAQDRGLPVAFQALVYPMLDDRTVLADRGADVGRLIWHPGWNRAAWEWFLGHPVTEDEPRPYASPARRADLHGLPPAWIGVGDIDLFHDEDVEYARRLEDAGVEVQLQVEPGMPHASDFLTFVPRMQDFRSSMIAALAPAVAPES